MSARQYRGRIAPSPSGFLHIGHAQTFKIAHARARERGGKIVLRMEDIDFERCRKIYSDAAVEDLKSIGLDWDEGDDVGGKFAPYTQSMRIDFYKAALKKLLEAGAIYPCSASRAQIREAGKFPARQFDFCDAERIFPPQFRAQCPREFPQNTFDLNWRFRVPDGEKIAFEDGAFGAQEFVAGEDFGDFIVWRKAGVPAYELAVVADDSAMEISEVVRGKDLLLSTARQILLYRALNLQPPLFYHCPLVLDKGGNKISKSTMKIFDAKSHLINHHIL